MGASEHAEINDYKAGYRAGHADGYEDRPRLYIFLNRTARYVHGYADGYAAGRGTLRYERTHPRPKACPIPDDRGNLPGDRWCGECLIYTNHSTSEHQQAEATRDAEGRSEP